ncbi:MAG: ABC transporter permease [Lachnospiraceae bacterium]|nr:ABC transporter permease [Lachnospiraceae bacterium]
MNFDDYKWDTVIEAKQNPFSVGLKQIAEYRDLIFLFVKRDIAVTYKQTILGPLWYLFQPVFTTVMFIIVFNHVASLGTNDVPPVLFYSIGAILWSFFSSLLTVQARVFYANKDIFGKVYFPRLTVPIAIIFGELLKFAIQFGLFVIIFVIYVINGYGSFLSLKLLFLPLIMLWIILMATGLGLMISSITTRYRDLAKALEFFLSMFMYAIPVVYPLSEVSGKLRLVFALNPITAILECFRYCCFGTGEVSLKMILYSVGWTLIILFGGILLFNKNEKVFVDVI